MQYSKRIVLGCLNTRIQSAKRRLNRPQKLDLTIPDKAGKIQSAIWPLAFYGAESQVIGDSHFVTLRRLATDALIGKHKFASSYIALQYLSDKVMDRCYMSWSQDCALSAVYFTITHSMWFEIVSHTSTQGPCGALASYLAKIMWTPLQGGFVDMPSGHQICLQTQSTKEILVHVRLFSN